MNGYKIRDEYAMHFLTFSVVMWIDIFTRPIYKHILIDAMNYCVKNKGLKIHAYVIMTNHIHVIWSSEKGNLSGIIRDYKKFTSAEIIKCIQNNPIESRKSWLLKSFQYFAKKPATHKVWTNFNHPIELNYDELTKSKLDYIHFNPVRQEIVTHPEEYNYSSASNYAQLTGLIPIEPI